MGIFGKRGNAPSTTSFGNSPDTTFVQGIQGPQGISSDVYGLSILHGPQGVQGIGSHDAVDDKRETGNLLALADELNEDGTINLIVADGIKSSQYRLTKKQISRFLEDLNEMHVLQLLARSE